MEIKILKYPFISIFILFALYFSPFLFTHSFAGNSDIFVHTALFKEYIFKIKEFLGLAEYGRNFYPSDGASLFLENMYGQASIFILAKMLFLSDQAATYLLAVILYSLNGWALFKLINLLTNHERASFIFGLFFSASCYMLSNIEFLNGISVFPIILAWYYLEKYIRSKANNDFYKSIVFLGLQTFFSGYYFLIGSVFITSYILYLLWNKQIKVSFKKISFSSGILFLFILPLLLQITSTDFSNAYNIFKNKDLGSFNITVQSFLISIPRNLLYGQLSTPEMQGFRTNNGFLIFLFLIIGLFSFFKNKNFLVLSGVIALLLSMGSFTINIFNVEIPSLYKAIFEWNMLGNLFRLPYRFFTLTLLIVSIISAFGYIKVEQKTNKKTLFALFVTFFLILENVEYLLFTPSQKDIKSYPEMYETLKKKDTHDITTIVNFPSSIYESQTKDLSGNENRREYIYMYWQTFHHMNIINGSASYFPKSRMDNNELMVNIQQSGNLKSLINNNQLDYVVFHKNLVYHPSELNILPFFENSDLLSKVYNDSSLAIFYTKQ